MWQRARWRASHTLGLLDETLAGSTFGILRRADLVPQDGEVRGEVNVEIVLDPPGHVRLPIPDDEIIDRNAQRMFTTIIREPRGQQLYTRH